MIHYMHDIPGRLRIKSLLVKKSKTAAHQITESVTLLNGVTGISVNPKTGSVLIKYDSKTISNSDILKHLQGEGYLVQPKSWSNNAAVEKLSRAVISQLLTDFIKSVAA